MDASITTGEKYHKRDNIQKSRSLNPFIFTHKANPIDPNPSVEQNVA
jgi:hypothetical protein